MPAMEMDFREYLEALEEERRKILVFKRELPLSLAIVSQAIGSCRQQLSGTTTTTEYLHGGQSECSEQTSSEGPVLEEFIPVKRDVVASDTDDEEQQSGKDPKENRGSLDKKKAGQSDWLRSAQLWNQTPDPSPKEEGVKKIAVVEVKNNGGAFQPFQKEKTPVKTNNPVVKGSSTARTAPVATSPNAEAASEGSGGGGKKEEKEGQSPRKQRRCWSPELHRRFLHALQQLGGSHVATPKQIRDLMKVDGLTNDEVKSHLQKYRLHTRRPTPAIHNNGGQQAPQFVVVGGIWVPAPDYAAVAVTTAAGDAAPSGIYSPVAAALPLVPAADDIQRPHPKFSDHSTTSPSPSSSTRTTRTACTAS